MAQKRILSIHGTVGSEASCKTRSLKYNQLISLLIKGIFLVSIEYGGAALATKLPIYLLS